MIKKKEQLVRLLGIEISQEEVIKRIILVV